MAVKEKKVKKKFWYFIEYHECVMCGISDTVRTRRYDPKPDDPNLRYKFVQEACGIHFC